MSLSSELISDFVKATRDETPTNQETTVYATVVINDNGTFVQIDGSETLTPVDTSVDIVDGDRVTVMIKNHTAMVTGNISSPAARVETVKYVEEQVAKKVSASEIEAEIAKLGYATVEELNAVSARIDNITATEITVEYLEANYAGFDDIDAINARIDNLDVGDLTAVTARIETLEANQITTTYLETTYATIENLNATNLRLDNLEADQITTTYLEANYIKSDKASIGTALFDVGLITSADIVEGHVTGFLDAVEVNANKITAGTLTVDRLVFRGSEQSIIYELNRMSRNLLPYPYYNRTHSDDGVITFTDNGDGTIDINAGTATANCIFVFRHFVVEETSPLVLPKGTYTISGGTDKIYLEVFKIVNGAQGNMLGRDVGNGATFTIEENTQVSCRIYISKGTVVPATTIEPMLAEGTEAKPFEPYRKNTQELTSETVNGEVLTDRTINADKIIAGSITSKEIHVAELFANEAAITTLVSQQIFSDAIAANSIVVGAGNTAAEALTAANTAKTNASNAVTTANTANSIANATKTTLAGLTKVDSNVTYIDGGKIFTGSITAKEIDVENLVTSSAFIDALSTNSIIVGATNKANEALQKIDKTVKSITMHYLASSASSGVTTSTSGWTTTTQSITTSKKYLWTYQTITYADNTSTNTTPVISGVYGNTGSKGDPGENGTPGEKGDPGATGTGVSKVIPLYYLKSNTTAPSAPTSAVTSTSTGSGVWTTAVPKYVSGYTYFTCTQTLYTNNTYSWSAVVADNALTNANSVANTANTNASNAVTTANTAKTDASNAVTTANTANTNASNAVTTANTANTNATSALNRATYHYGTCSTAAGTAAKVVTLSGFSLYTGAQVTVQFTNANTAANPTLNVNSTGAKSIRVNNANITSKYYWKANNTVTFVYNGTYWVIADSSANTILADWASSSNVTYIDGNKIYTGTITADKIAADAIKSKNYKSDTSGSFLNLEDGSFDSKYLKWSSDGTIECTSGFIGGFVIEDNALSVEANKGEYRNETNLFVDVTRIGFYAEFTNGWNQQLQIGETGIAIQTIKRYDGGGIQLHSIEYHSDRINANDISGRVEMIGFDDLLNLRVGSGFNNVTMPSLTLTGNLSSNCTTGTYLAANQGETIINSTATAGAFTMLSKLNSKNGYFTDGVYGTDRVYYYTSKTTADTDKANTYTKRLILLNESGNSTFPGTVTISGGASIAGTLTLTRNQDASGTTDNAPALIVGGPRTAAHLEMDANEIMAKANGTTTAPLYINSDGGDIYLGGNATVNAIVNGPIKATGFIDKATGSSVLPFLVNGSTNANGAIRFPNIKIQIAWMRYQAAAGGIGVNTAWGSVYTGTQRTLPQWVASFSSQPVIIKQAVFQNSSGGKAAAITATFGDGTASVPGQAEVVRGSALSPGSNYGEYYYTIAIGPYA